MGERGRPRWSAGALRVESVCGGLGIDGVVDGYFQALEEVGVGEYQLVCAIDIRLEFDGVVGRSLFIEHLVLNRIEDGQDNVTSRRSCSFVPCEFSAGGDSTGATSQRRVGDAHSVAGSEVEFEDLKTPRNNEYRLCARTGCGGSVGRRRRLGSSGGAGRRRGGGRRGGTTVIATIAITSTTASGQEGNR